MPLVTAAVLVYCAALLAASGRAIAATSCALVLIIWQARGSQERYALATITLAASVSANVASSALRSCQKRLLAQHAWELTLRADAAPGEFVPATHACGLNVRMSIVRGRAPLGAGVMVLGDAFDTRGAILIKNATIRV